MSETSKKIDNYVSKVSGLKKKFVQIYKSDQNAANELLRQMCVYHGCAIYDDAKDKEKILKNESNNISDSECLRLSSNTSFLHVIHSHIRHCQILLYKFTNNSYNGYSEKNSDIPTSEIRTVTPTNTDHDNIHITIKKNNTGIDIISIDNIKTDSESSHLSFHTSDLFTSEDKKKNKSFASLTSNAALSDYINHMNTSEADRLEKAYEKNSSHDSNTDNRKDTQKKFFEINKPTIINFWADWCGWSKQFMPTWRKFEEDAEKNFPELQVLDLNVGRNKELDNVAKDADVSGYPTLVFFNKGLKHTAVASRMNVADLNKFVTSHM